MISTPTGVKLDAVSRKFFGNCSEAPRFVTSSGYPDQSWSTGQTTNRTNEVSSCWISNTGFICSLWRNKNNITSFVYSYSLPRLFNKRGHNIEEKSSQFNSTQLKQLRKESLKKNSGLNGIRTHDLCNAGAVLYQLSYQANCELVIL